MFLFQMKYASVCHYGKLWKWTNCANYEKKIIMISASVRLHLSVSYIYSKVWFVSAALYIKVCVCVCVRVCGGGGVHTEQEVCAIKGSCLHIAKSLQDTGLQIRGGEGGVSWTQTLEGAIKKNKKTVTIMCILVQTIVLFWTAEPSATGILKKERFDLFLH